MRRIHRPIFAIFALALGLALAACSSGNFDPTDIFSSGIFDTKKRVEGDRKAVFPEGVPGASQGVPPELVKGHQPAPTSDAQAGVPAPESPHPTTAAAAGRPARLESAPGPEEKPKPAATKPAAAPAQDPPEASVWPEAARPQRQQARPSSSSPWPDAPRQQPAPQAGPASPSPSPWPDPPPSGTFSR
jgi:hypothetical protein